MDQLDEEADEEAFDDDSAFLATLLSAGRLAKAAPADIDAFFAGVRRWRRQRTLHRGLVGAVALAAVIAVVTVVTVVVPGTSAPPRTVGKAPPASTFPTSPPSTVPTSNPVGSTIQQDFRRTVDGGAIVIRAFHWSGTTENRPSDGVGFLPVAVPPNSLQIDVTTPTGVVEQRGQAPPQLPSSGFAPVTSPLSGDPGETVGIAWVYSAPDIATVQLLSGGTVVDQMTPVGGWSVVAMLNPPTIFQVGAVTTKGVSLPEQDVTPHSVDNPLNSPPYFVRTTADGLFIRGGEYQGFITMAISNTWAGQNFEGFQACTMTQSDTIYAEPAQTAAGIQKHSPYWPVPVLVGPGVATVEVTFADGASDEMTPVNGLAILAHNGTSPPVSAVARDNFGTVVATQNLQKKVPPGTLPPCLQ